LFLEGARWGFFYVKDNLVEYKHMKLIVGLGNPGAQYEQTRHNVGFRVLDLYAQQLGWKWERRGRTMLASGTIGTEKVILAKPITFMNLSGEAVGELVRYYKLTPEDVLAIYDELDLPVAKVRLRANGSAGGHNGVSSLIQHLHTNQFPRLRVGIGRPANQRMDTIHYVLGIPPTDERIELANAEERAVAALPLILEQGVDAAMNIINADPEAQRKAEERRRLQEERRLQQAAQRAAVEGANEQAGTE
jgi:PTH1 family peptidyl-tRNA hydrolase